MGRLTENGNKTESAGEDFVERVPLAERKVQRNAGFKESENSEAIRRIATAAEGEDS
jgi:hypothetical protein